MKTQYLIENDYITNLTISQQPNSETWIEFPDSKYKRPNLEFPCNKYSRVYKAIRLIRDTLIANFEPNKYKFLTLTYETKHNTLDRKAVKNDLDKFCDDLRKYFRKLKNNDGSLRYPDFELQYIAVFEKHKIKPSYHIHMICNIPYVNLNYDVVSKQIITKEMKKQGFVWVNIIQNLWKKGFISLSNISNPKEMQKALDSKIPVFGITKTIEYLCKYLTKEFKAKIDDETLKGENLYYMSKNWKKPEYKKSELKPIEEFNLISKDFKEMKKITNDLGGFFKLVNFKDVIFIYRFLIPTENLKEFNKRMFEIKGEKSKIEFNDWYETKYNVYTANEYNKLGAELDKTFNTIAKDFENLNRLSKKRRDKDLPLSS